MENKEILNVKEAADYLNVAQGTIRGWVFDRTIPFFKMGACVRFNRSELDKWRMMRSNPVSAEQGA